MRIPTPESFSIAFLEGHNVRLLPGQQFGDVRKIAPDRLIPDQCLMQASSSSVDNIEADDSECIQRIPVSWRNRRRLLNCLNLEVSNRRPIRHPGKSHSREEHQAGQKNRNQCQLFQSLLHVTVVDDGAM